MKEMDVVICNDDLKPNRIYALKTSMMLVVFSTIISISMGLRQSLGLFLEPMYYEIGTSAASFGFAMALQNVVWGASQPVVGFLGDKYGTRPVLIGSAALYAAGLWLISTGYPVIGLDLGAGVLIGVGVSGTSFGVLLGEVSRVVPPEKRSMAVGVVSAGGSMGTFILAPLGQALINFNGWASALGVFACLALSMGVIAVSIGNKDAKTPNISPAPNVRPLEALAQALRHREFIILTVAFFACGFQLLFIATHLPQFLATCGIPAGVSANALALIGLGNAVGSVISGVLASKYKKERLLSLVYLLRTIAIGVYLSLPITAESTLIFGTIIGVLWFSVNPVVTGIIGDLFGFRNFNTLFGFVFFSHQLGAFFGAWIGGMTFDFTGSYDTAWLSMIAVGVVAAAIQWFMSGRATGKSGYQTAT
jgi:predicted MFS family arabinose efflux permease